MVNKISEEKRKKIMGSIKGKNTKLESMVSKELWHRGIRFRKNVKSLYGTPDIAIKKYKIVIFIDSCFWHACELHGTLPQKNQMFWIKKFNRNKERDFEVNNYYIQKQWHLLRIWEHDLKRDFVGSINKIVNLIKFSKMINTTKNKQNYL
ncbi:very short patch repair endonuclease [Metabacillus idriensis]|uniref:very short patch repair endonuclease n=1 Tax=Metabacillus idriensis TaxID=324768 RepID=UPI001749C4DA|nr:very short patch repair endonuclease [Metabacillus idriensis]